MRPKFTPNLEMVLTCQMDSFLEEFTSTLVGCIEDNFIVSIAPGTQKQVHGIGIILEDTILFPEGGGQPCDEGELRIEREDGNVDEVRISHVFHQGGKVVHLVEEMGNVPWSELRPGTLVHQKLCWPRRSYHMVHHSGQHLISALAEKLFNWETLSWCLGPRSCYVELGTEEITEEQYHTLESEVNRHIEMNLRVKAHVFKKGDAELEKAKTRGLPEDHVGDIRVIEIEGVDNNMCCGTHVNSLGQLEVIKFLLTGKRVSKKKKTCLLNFIVGKDSVFERFDNMQAREDSIGSILNKPPEEHVATIAGMKESLSKSKKAVKELQKEVAMMLINNFKEKEPHPDMFCLHRPDGDLELLSFVARQFKEMQTVLFLTVGEKEGNILLEGSKDLIAELAPKLSSLLNGKGKVTGNRFQARVSKLSEVKNAEDLIRSAIANCSKSP